MKPALTAEEWEGHEANNWGVCNVAYPAGDNGLVLDGQWERHGLAAQCLHNQPFGFTRKDVEMLREEGEWALQWALDHACKDGEESKARFDNLADRIEALLPPEATAGRRHHRQGELR